jgi:beta-galactosidase GanA
MFIYGTQYFRPPYPSREDWRDDLIKIKESDFNTVKLWAVWSWIERRPGEYYFDDLDTIIDLCEEIGLNVVINTIPEGMPYWASRVHGDAFYTTETGFVVRMNGAPNMPSGGAPGICQDKKEAGELQCKFISTVVERYSRRENLIAFDLWNEPHMEPIWDYSSSMFCYCEYSKALFLEWVKDKYKTISNLNKAWMRAYGGWEDVSPPIRFGTYPDMIDWRNFWMLNLGKWMDRRVEAARKVANGKTLMTHMAASGYLGTGGEGGLGFMLADEFIFAEKVDKFGLTSFPKWLMQNDFIMHLAHAEMIAAASGKTEFWQSELQSGAGKWESYGRPVALPEEIRLWNWSAVASGAKGIMYWQWRPEPSGTEAPGFGLTTIDGEVSQRTIEAAACSRKFNSYVGFEKASRLHEVNGIYVSRHSDICLFAANKGESVYAKGLYGAFKACYEKNIPVRFVHADRLKNAVAEGLEVLYAPVAIALSPEDMENLAGFVYSGGTLITEACPGFFNEKGIMQKEWNFLRDIFGLSIQEVDGKDRNQITFLPESEKDNNGYIINGRFYRHSFSVWDPSVQVRGNFENGQPAVFEHKYGKGKAILFGSFISVSVALDNDLMSVEAICHLMNRKGYDIIEDTGNAEPILTRVHSLADQYFITLVNYSSTDKIAEITLKETWNLDDIEGSTVPIRLLDGNKLKVSVKAMNGEIVRLSKKR